MEYVNSIHSKIQKTSLAAFAQVSSSQKSDFLLHFKKIFENEVAAFSSSHTKLPPASHAAAAPQKINERSESLPFSRYDALIRDAASKYDVPFNLIKKVIMAESSFNPSAVSKSGAIGLMQLMPQTAKWLGVHDAKDPAQNIEGGVKYIRKMLDRYENDAKLALAAYNAGPGNVDKYGGVPPFDETKNYVKKILG